MRTADPHGKIAATIDPARLIGCVVYPAVSNCRTRRDPVQPLPARFLDVREHSASVGYPTSSWMPDSKSPILTSIRNEIWLKKWGNLSFNLISALTHTTLVDLCRFPLSRNPAETMTVCKHRPWATSSAWSFVYLWRNASPAPKKVGKHKASMLQDVEAGRDQELDALVGSVIELAESTRTPVPQISAVNVLV